MTAVGSLFHNSVVAIYQFEPLLRARAAQFLRALSKEGIKGSIVDGSIREYSIKVSISLEGRDSGSAVLYYAPKSDSFSMKTHELKDKTIASLLESCWNEVPSGSQRAAARYDIYVDGSYVYGATGYGAVILEDGKVVEELFGLVDAIEVNGTRQVAGELAAVKAALKWCVAHSVTEVSIYYDYFGIEKWATREWKANQPLTRDYASFVAQSPVKISWHKVASHTGNRWNDRADALAKLGAGSPSTRPEDQDSISALLKKTDEWIEFLMVKGIEASFYRIYNDQFARVYIIQNDKPVGTFDLYNTLKKPFSPYLHDFRDEEEKARIQSLWKVFLATSQTFI